MNFNEFCKFLNVTRDERRKLVQFLATLRHAETMKLAEPPPESSTTASGVAACVPTVPDQAQPLPAAPVQPGDAEQEPNSFHQVAPFGVCTVPGETLWCVNVHGPDDVYAMPNKLAALERANDLNVFYGSLEHHEFDPIMRAVVIPWMHSAESHAEDMARTTPAAAPGSADNASPRSDEKEEPAVSLPPPPKGEQQ